MLVPKDLTLNFYEPKKGYNSYAKNSTVSLRVKRKIKGLHMKEGSTQRYIKTTPGLNIMYKERYADSLEYVISPKDPSIKNPSYKIAFSFGGGEENLAILNPPASVPQFTFLTTHTGKENMLNNSALVDDIWKHFGIDDKDDFIYLKLEFFTTLNKLDLYKLTVLDKNEKPYFSDRSNQIRETIETIEK